MREEPNKSLRQRSAAGWANIAEKHEKFAQKGQEKKKGGKTGKGKGKEQYRVSDTTQQYRASDQAPTKGQGKAQKPWNQPGQRRSVFETPDYGTPEYDWLQPWTESSSGPSSSWWSGW